MKISPKSDPNICEYAMGDNGITSPLLIDLPHGGTIYPDDFGFSCPRSSLELCEEKYLDEIFIPPVLLMGGAVIRANFPRTYIDVNRASNDIDQLLFEIPWTESVADKGRSVYGHGVIMRLIHEGHSIYSRPLTHNEARHRIKSYYLLYHNMLSDFSNSIYEHFEGVYHLNCHSMPSSVARYNFPHTPPDFILGDLDGRSCGREFRHHISETLKDMGYRVAINQLYKGAEIINRYGQPAWCRHSLQIEMNRALFQNEQTGEKNNNFSTLKEDIQKLILKTKDFIKI